MLNAWAAWREKMEAATEPEITIDTPDDTAEIRAFFESHEPSEIQRLYSLFAEHFGISVPAESVVIRKRPRTRPGDFGGDGNGPSFMIEPLARTVAAGKF